MTNPYRTFVGLVALTLLGQLAAVAYEVVVAARFGTGGEADALAFSLMLVMAAANEISTWISTVFVPQYVDLRTKLGQAVAVAFFRKSVSLLVGGAGALALVIFGTAPGLVALLAPGLSKAGLGLLRLFAPLILLVPLSTILSSALQAHERFSAAGTRQLFWYGVTLISLAVLPGSTGVFAVPIGMIAAFLFFCALLGVSVMRTPAWSESSAGATPPLRHLAAPLVPLALASLLNYVNVVFERAIAARQPSGSLAALTYAFRLLNFPLNLFVWNATAMLLPTLAGHAARNDSPTLEALVRRALRLSLVFTVLLAALAISLAEPAVRLLLERGAFTATSTAFTATALACYAPAVIGIAGAQVLSRTYQALQEVGRMVSRGVAVIILNLALMPLLAALLGFAGLAVATSVTALVLYGVMLIGIRHRLPGLTVGSIWDSAWRAGVAGGVAVAVIWTLRVSGFESGIPMLAALLLSGAATYAVVLFLLSREDARLALAFLLPMLALRAPGRS